MTQSRMFKGLVMLGLGAVLGTGLGCRSRADTSSPDEPPRGISVVGDGEATAAPDIAHVEVGVQVRADSVKAGTEQINRQMATMLERLEQLGVESKDIQTRNISIYQQREPEPPRPLPSEGVVSPSRGPQSYYQLQNIVTITVRDLDELGKILAAATEAGANEMHGIRFAIDDDAALEKAALDEAYADARANAEHLAQLAGVELGPVLSVELGEARGGGPMPGPVMARMEAADSMPVERGEMTVTRQVYVRYALR